MAINYRKNELEERMLLNLSKKGWTHGLKLEPFEKHQACPTCDLHAPRMQGFARLSAALA